MIITNEAAGGLMVAGRADIHVTGRRVIATIVDCVLIGLGGSLSAEGFGTIGTDGTGPPTLSTAQMVLVLTLIAAYYVLLEGYLGQTVGKMLVGIKVVSEATGDPPGLAAAAVRTLLRLVDGVFCYLVAFIAVLASAKRQRLGDMAARTLVVRRGRAGTLPGTDRLVASREHVGVAQPVSLQDFPHRPPPQPTWPTPLGRRMDGRLTVLSWVWAVTPLVTVGLATPFTFAYAASRLRSKVYAGVAVAYATLVALVAFLPETAAEVCVGLSWVAGSVHAVAVRRSVFLAPPGPGKDAMVAALDAAKTRQKLRREARQIVARDPNLARELGIGRPDLAREIDDGGLVDVNTAPIGVLARLPGMTTEMAQRVVGIRRTRGAYESMEELAALAELPPELTDRLAEYLLFLQP